MTDRESEEQLPRRADFRPSDRVASRTVYRHAEDHYLKLTRYRDQVLAHLRRNGVDDDTFERFDARSMEALGIFKPNTEIALYSDLLQYLNYCSGLERDHGVALVPLPFSDYCIDAYLSHLWAQGRKRATIDRHVASLVRWAKIMEWDDPRLSFKAQTRLEHIRNTVMSNTRQAQGLRAEHLMQAIESFDPDIPRDRQDITLLFVAFETLCRQSELVRFNWHQFELQKDRTGLLFLVSSKTDKTGEGEYLFLSANTCEILLAWRALSNPENRDGPIFRGIYSDGRMGKRLSTRGVQRCFKRIARRLGLEPSVFSGHSTRVGAAQEMIERNIDSAKVMLSGRWKSTAMLTQYAKKIKARRSGMAELADQIGWNRASAAPDTDSPPTPEE